MSHRFLKINPPPVYITKRECEKLIDDAIRRHNRNASLISVFLGIIFLALFAEGFFRTIGMIPPFMGIDVNIVSEVVEKLQSAT
jgi:hypothetical protein